MDILLRCPLKKATPLLVYIYDVRMRTHPLGDATGYMEEVS